MEAGLGRWAHNQLIPITPISHSNMHVACCRPDHLPPFPLVLPISSYIKYDLLPYQVPPPHPLPLPLQPLPRGPMRPGAGGSSGRRLGLGAEDSRRICLHLFVLSFFFLLCLLLVLVTPSPSCSGEGEERQDWEEEERQWSCVQNSLLRTHITSFTQSSQPRPPRPPHLPFYC